MSLKINHNLDAMDTLRNLTTAQGSFSQSMQRLSSGKRINSAADDAAGYAISNKLMSQSKGLDQASANAQDGISMVQTANGGLQTVQNLLQRFRQLAVQSANDTNTTSDRQALQAEGNQISQEITQIATTTQFNTKNLLDGSLGASGQLNATNTLAAATATYNGALYSNGNSPVLNTGNLAAKGPSGATNTYTLTTTAVGAVGTVGAQGAGTTAPAVTDLIGAASQGYQSYTGSFGGAQTGVLGGTYNLTVAGAKGSATISITAGGTTGDKFQDVLDKINGASNQTGVSATFTAATGLTLTNSVAGSSQSVTATGQDQLLRGLGLMAKDASTYTTQEATTAAQTKISTATGSGTDGVATLSGGQFPAAVTLQANGNRFSDASSGFSYDLNGVKGVQAGSATFSVNTTGTATLQVGANANQNLNVSIGSMTAASLGVGNGNVAIDITSQSAANAAISTIDSAIQTVSTQASSLGAVQNRLTAAIGNLAVGSENMTAAYSAITDVNMAQESTSLATAQILQQSSTAMLAQANQAAQGVLKLLG